MVNFLLFERLTKFKVTLRDQSPLPHGVWEGLRFVIVALPGLFSYLFFSKRILCPLHIFYKLLNRLHESLRDNIAKGSKFDLMSHKLKHAPKIKGPFSISMSLHMGYFSRV